MTPMTSSRKRAPASAEGRTAVKRAAAMRSSGGASRAADAGNATAAPAQLLRAFDEIVALLQPAAAAPLLWCSPAWARLLTTDQPRNLSLAQLCAQLHGLDAGLQAVAAAPAGTPHAPTQSQDPWHGTVSVRPATAPAPAGANADAAPRYAEQQLQATLQPLSDGALALRLQREPAHGRATRRHLEDREQLLFTSRRVAVGEMATTLAHELNQPLGAVANVLRGLAARLAAPDARLDARGLATLTQGVQLAQEQVQYAAGVIARIRDYTQSRQPQREHVHVHALLRRSLSLMDWEFERYGISPELVLARSEDADASVIGDGVMLQQVIVNLLRNAVDAMMDTPVGARRLTVTTGDDGSGNVELAIADTGQGMGQDAAATLFTPFLSSKPTGMGIGLNICRSMIELHRGRLWFTPNTPRGCVFHIALPAAMTADVGAPPHSPDHGRPEP